MTLKHLGRSKKEKSGKKQARCTYCKKITPLHIENCFRARGKLYVTCKISSTAFTSNI